MRRAVYRKQTTGMSLFPFLAVLICTMGSLIVLLVMVLQQARVQAAATPLPVVKTMDVGDQEADKKLREAREDLDWRRDVLEKQRADQSEELSKSRLELSHLEDHIRRLQEQWKQIEAKVNDLKKLGESQTQDQAALKEELERVKAQLEEAKRQLEEAKQKIKDKPRSFAIIPYQGPHGTKRRPIYVECAEEGIILHPENIVFQPADFQGPLGSGNPLDAALRTVREYIATHGDSKKDGEPYPLLLVRPNGAVAYSMARSAMRSWDDEFGYELIDEKMELKFPPADPELEALLMRTINDARTRQMALAAAMPARYKGEGSTGFVAGPNGGFTPSLIDDDEPVTSMRGGSGAGGRGSGSGSSGGGGIGGGRDARTGFASGRNGIGSGTGGQLANGPYGSGGGASGGAGTMAQGPYQPGSNGIGENRTGANGQNAGGTGSGAVNGQAGNGPGGSGSGAAGSGATGNNAQGITQNGGTQGPGGPNSALGYGGNGTPGGSGMGSPGGGAAGPVAPGMSAMSGGVPGGNSSSGSRSNSSSSAGGTSGQAGGTSSTQVSLAKSKGRDWALPNKVSYATGITRPIRVQCFQDRVVILSERGEAQRPKTVMFKDGEVRPVAEEFVSNVWKHMETWGLAVAGGYWKPVLRVEVAPGAEQQFADLDELLQGSGLVVQRK